MNPNSYAQPAQNPYRPVATAPLPPPTAPAPLKKSSGNALKTVLLVFFILLSLIAIGFLAYLFVEYTDLKNNVDEKISLATAAAEKETTEKLEEAFAEREKEPYSIFSGPVDYGGFSFKYPKTWSVYIAEDAAKGGDFVAYLNPAQVNPDPDDGINAIRVLIENKLYDDVLEKYQRDVEDEELTAEVIKINGETANYFRSTSENEWQGAVVLIRIRDKTVHLQTDAEIFLDDFEKILETVTYNQ